MNFFAKTIPLAIALVTATTLNGQKIRTFCDQLAQRDTISGASVLIEEHGRASEVIDNYDSSKRPGTVNGFRIRIFFDNSQTARQNAWAASEKFRELFGSIPTYMAYDSPSWVVNVGNFVTTEEALIFLNRIRPVFKTAFVRKETIPLVEFLKETDPLPENPTEEQNGDVS